MDDLFTHIMERKAAFVVVFFIVFTLSYIILVAIDFVPEPVTESGLVEEAEDTSAEENEEAGAETSSNVMKETIGEMSGGADSEIDMTLESSEPGQTDLEPTVVSEDVSDLSLGLSGGENIEPTVPVGQRVLPVKLTIDSLDREVAVLNPQSRVIADLDEALLAGVVRHPDSAGLGEDGNVFILGHSSYLPTVFNKNFQAFNGIQNLQWGDSIELTSGAYVYEYQVDKVYRARAQDLTVPIAGDEKRLTLATCNSFGSTDDRFIVEAKQIGVRAL
jgi:LPXTG-site transpeptidase (sortase) family protein